MAGVREVDGPAMARLLAAYENNSAIVVGKFGEGDRLPVTVVDSGISSKDAG